MEKQLNWVILAVLGLSLLLGISIAFRNQTALINFFSIDDAFYYFQSAKNFTQGKGISFDGIARGNGYHPLWMLVCIPVFALTRFDLWLPLRILVVIQAVLHAVTGYFIFKMLVQKVAKPLSVLAMVIWLFSPTIFSVVGSNGLETGINMFCITGLLYFVSTWSILPKDQVRLKHYLMAGILASLTLLARLDNIFLLCFIGAWLVLKNWRLNRTWIMMDFLLTAFSAIFSYVAYVDLSTTLYTLMPNIEVIIVTSMVLFPLGQFLSGVYHLDQQSAKKEIASRIVIGVGLGSAMLTVALLLIYPNGGYSRAAMVIQIGTFLLFTLMAKLFLTFFNALPQISKEVSPQQFHIKDIYKLDWLGLVRKAACFFGPLFTTLGLFLVFNHFYFGTSMPLSGKIKGWWGSFITAYGERPTTLQPFLGLNEKGPWGMLTLLLHTLSDLFKIDLSPSLSLLLTIVLVIILFVFILLSKKTQERINSLNLQPFFLGVIFHASYYTMTGYVGYRSWYWAPEMLFMLLFGVILLDSVLLLFTQKWLFLKNEWLRWGLAGITILSIIIHFAAFNLSFFSFSPNEEHPAIHNVRIVQQCTPEGSVIGMTGGGYIGYFIERRTITNLDGLINGVEYYSFLTEFRMTEYLDKIGMDFVFGNETMLFDSEPYMQSLTGRLVEVNTKGCSFEGSFKLYEFAMNDES
jgi:hypothetical protein